MEDREALKKVFGIRIVEKPGVYLGSELDFTRRKGDLFKRILNRFHTRLANWRTPTLSFPSRLVLVKHTLSSIPVYLFSVFRAPCYFVAKVRSLMVRFLWGKGDGGGISWKRWEELCKPMYKGGLGLRELGCFNQALLAKMAWRLIEDPNSLVAKVLLGKYCWGRSLWECSPKPGCSWGWRSIMWGLDLLKKRSFLEDRRW